MAGRGCKSSRGRTVSDLGVVRRSLLASRLCPGSEAGRPVEDNSQCPNGEVLLVFRPSTRRSSGAMSQAAPLKPALVMKPGGSCTKDLSSGDGRYSPSDDARRFPLRIEPRDPECASLWLTRT